MYIWICVGIWLLDRSLRIFRIIFFGRCTAKAKLIPGTAVIKLTVYPSRDDVGFAPGAHYYLYFPNRKAFWESHPFTAASWRGTPPEAPEKVKIALEGIPGATVDSGKTLSRQSTVREPPTTSSAPVSRQNSKRTVRSLDSGRTLIAPPNSVVTDAALSSISEKTAAATAAAAVVAVKTQKKHRPKLIFYIHIRHGFTLTLLRPLVNTKSITMPVFLEGPYGHTHAAATNPLVIAGGVGISTALPYLTAHLASRRSRRFHLMWVVREGALAEDVFSRIDLRGRKDLEISVYITRAGGQTEWKVPEGVRVRCRRPRIEALIMRIARERGGVQVVACGGARVVDAARRGAVEAEAEIGGVRYWEEGYGG